LIKIINSICAICIQQIQTQALFKLQGKDFILRMNDINWVSIEETTNIVIDHLIELAFEILVISKFLPFIKPIYKLHNKTYMGIIGAHGIISPCWHTFSQ
jgi:hypothetical protein